MQEVQQQNCAMHDGPPCSFRSATGREVFDWILDQGYYSERDTSNVVRQVLEAVAYLHSLHIVHRNLKVSSCGSAGFPNQYPSVHKPPHLSIHSPIHRFNFLSRVMGNMSLSQHPLAFTKSASNKHDRTQSYTLQCFHQGTRDLDQSGDVITLDVNNKMMELMFIILQRLIASTAGCSVLENLLI